MKNYLLSLMLVSMICKGQDNSKFETPIHFKSPLVDMSRNDFSFLDKVYLIAKSISPESSIFPKKDTLFLQFPLPGWVNIADNDLLKGYAQADFDAIFSAAVRDSVKYNVVGIQVCRDSVNCATLWYDMTGYNFKRFSLQDKLTYFVRASLWPNRLFETETLTGKKSLMLYYFIDSVYSYAGPMFVRSFYQSSAAVISDLVYKSPSRIRRHYEDLMVLFCCKGQLAYYWRLPITKAQLSMFYKVKFYESNTLNSNFGDTPILWNVK